jgi:hypothetical protein
MKNPLHTLKASFLELKSVKGVVLSAILLAANVVFAYFATVYITPNIKIAFTFVIAALTGMLLGPGVAGVTFGLTDFIQYLFKPVGPYFPGFTISNILIGLIYGFLFYKKKPTILRAAIASAVIGVFINIFLNTYWLSLLYGKGYLLLLPGRVVKNLIMIPVETMVIFAVNTAVHKLIKSKRIPYSF